MTETQKEVADNLIAELEAGILTTDQLRQGIEEVARQNGRKQQDLLYLQTSNTSPHSQVVGMMRIEDGERSEGALEAEKWPYQTVLDAVKEGWRIISFPNMALLAMDHDDSHGLGFEFILERWR